jgi:ubiquitin-like 1-activating enzyme E1 B
MAGNIIHAIATTNAVISGLIVIEALKLLSGNAAACSTSFLLQHISNKKLITPMTSPEPRPECPVCSTAQATIVLDTTAMTLDQFVAKVHLVCL